MNKKYIIVLDTETANTHSVDGKLDMSDTLVYDIGWQVVDLYGKVYEEKSYINKEIFCDMPNLMQTAYYANKIPKYIEEIKKGKRIVSNFYSIRKDLLDTMARYNTKIVSAHNMKFDKNALTVSQRYITKSKYRYFFPFDTEFWDTMKMANDVIVPMKKYQKFCFDNGYVTKHKKPRPKVTAEVLWKFISNNNDFIESHTGLEDVQIESQILAYCHRKHKKMRRRLYE